MNEALIRTLSELDLCDLLPRFEGQDIDDSVLSDLSDSDLKDIGIDKLGTRKKLLAAFAKSGGGAVAVSAVEEPTAQGSAAPPSKTAATPVEATKDSPWVNTLGMPFVSIPRFDTRFCIWPVRVQDYEAFCMASSAKFPEIPFSQESDHPIVGVSWNDAIDFCVWLTGKERGEGKIDEKSVYRLPTDLEWSAAVGLPHEPEATPAQRHLKAPGYPWGLRWPPPQGAGNYEHHRKDQVCLRQLADSWAIQLNSLTDASEPSCRQQYGQISRIFSELFNTWSNDWAPVDDHEFTSPAGSFSGNSLGIFDLGGNVWEWCMDSWSTSDREMMVSRGGSYSLGFNETKSFEVQSLFEPSGKNEEFQINVPADNRELYRSSYRDRTESHASAAVLTHSGLPPLAGGQIDNSGWKKYPNNGFRVVVAISPK
jgi:formylglycine-generating enzyme required for sulfatase activity